MVVPLQPPLAPPRRGKRLRVLGIARISGMNQDERSLADQEALLRHFLDARLADPYDLEMIAARGKGEDVIREDFLLAVERVETGTFDLVVMEDLGRIVRRVHAQLFCETALDAGTRVITLNDQIDTARDEWRVLAGFACMRHELYNTDTSKRIIRSLRNRFPNGGVLQRLIYGYVKKPGAKTDADVYKDPAAEPVYAEVFRLLDGGATYAEIADWLRANDIKPGPACRGGVWTSSNVSQWLHNTAIKGLRVRNKRMAVRVNKTGRRRTIQAPPEYRLERFVPHWVFIAPAEYDRIMRKADRKNAKLGRKKLGNPPTGASGGPTRRSPWPGGWLRCGVCGRRLVYGGHGQSDQLLCAGATDHQCWNGVTVNGPLAARKLGDAVLRAIAELPDFNAILAADFDQETAGLQRNRDKIGCEITARIGKLERERDNLVLAIREVGHSAVLMAELRRAEADLQEAADRKTNHDRLERRPVRRPGREELRDKASAAFAAAAADTPEFGRLLGRLLPLLQAWPVRLCTGGRSGPRVIVKLDLTTLLPDTRMPDGLEHILRPTISVNLFDAPEPERLRAKVVELTAAGRKQREIAAELGTHQATVQRAVALQRTMDARETQDAYEALSGPPDEDHRWRRHRHRRYKFEPLPGYPMSPSDPV